jgi:hypothetical protein
MNEIKKIEVNALQSSKTQPVSYLLKLRKILEEESTISEKINEFNPAISAKEPLIDFIKTKYPEDFASYEDLEESVTAILKELDLHRSKIPSLYLVDQNTGKTVVPFTKEAIYQPPDYIGLDGRLKKSRPIVHPGISSSLALLEQEEEKQKKLLVLAKTEKSHYHLVEDKMTNFLKVKLSENGFTEQEIDGPWKQLEFGKENEAGVEQAVSSSFHRIELFTSIICKKLKDICGENKKCQIGKIQNHKNSKFRWYTLNFKTLNTVGLNENSSQN